MREECYEVETDLEDRAVHSSNIRQNIHQRIDPSTINIVEWVLADIDWCNVSVLGVYLIIIEMTILYFDEVDSFQLSKLQKIILELELWFLEENIDFFVPLRLNV